MVTIYRPAFLGSSFARNLKVNPFVSWPEAITYLGPEALAQPAVTGKIEPTVYPLSL